MLSNQDFQAIGNFNVDKRIPGNERLYLKVVGKGDKQHLEAVSKNWFGRLLMKLGFGSASMPKVAAYVNSKLMNFNTDGVKDPKKQIENIVKLQNKMNSYAMRHIRSGASINTAATSRAFSNLEQLRNALEISGNQDEIIASL